MKLIVLFSILMRYDVFAVLLCWLGCGVNFFAWMVCVYVYVQSDYQLP